MAYFHKTANINLELLVNGTPTGGHASDCYLHPDLCNATFSDLFSQLYTFTLPLTFACFKYHYPISIPVVGLNKTITPIEGYYWSTGKCKADGQTYECLPNSPKTPQGCTLVMIPDFVPKGVPEPIPNSSTFGIQLRYGQWDIVWEGNVREAAGERDLKNFPTGF